MLGNDASAFDNWKFYKLQASHALGFPIVLSFIKYKFYKVKLTKHINFLRKKCMQEKTCLALFTSVHMGQP